MMRRSLKLSAVFAVCTFGCKGGADPDDGFFGDEGTDSMTSGDGDGESAESGDNTGDGDTVDGDGDGDTTGDGDGDTTGDGDGDGDTTGDGDGDTTGDGDGDTTGDGDGDTTGDGDGDGDSTTGEDPIPCDIAEAELIPIVPHVVLVLDKSGSMIQNTWDHDADPNTAEVTRWKSLHGVVSLIVNSFDDKLDFGAQLFPSKTATNDYNSNACLVDTPPEVLVAANNAIAVLLGIPTANSNNIRGGTPASKGMDSAIDHLVDIDDGDPSAVILVTDGAANCRTDAANNFQLFESYDVNLAGIVGDAFTDLDIPTYVVGIDISDVTTLVTGMNGHPADGEPDGISPYDQLNLLAVAGGKPKGGFEDFYHTNNQVELEAALQTIIDDAISCTVILDPVPEFPNLVEVLVDDQDVPHVMDCANEDGWVYTNEMGPYDSIELCGSWCEALKDAEIVKAEYFCNPG